MKKIPALLLAFALTGCGEAATDDTSAAPTAAATQASTPSPPAPEPSPTPTELTIEQAGQQYLKLVEPFNVALNGLYDYLGTTGDVLEQEELAKAKPLAADLADANRTFTTSLLGASWPDIVQADIEKLAGVATQQQADFRGMAEAKTVEQFDAANDATRELNSASTGAAELLRQKLGLGETANTDQG